MNTEAKKGVENLVNKYRAILDKELLETIISIHMRVALYMSNVLVECYQNINPSVILDDFITQAQLLKERYERF